MFQYQIQKKTIFNQNGIDLSNWKTELSKSETPSSIEKILSTNKLPNQIFVDCTASEDVTNQYANILTSGFHLVTANKRGNSGTMELYNKLRILSRQNRVQFLYSTNCGAGLPVIETIKSLYSTGDELVEIKAVASGSLSFIFTQLSSKSFSEVVNEAKRIGYTEPDPRDDLSCGDVVRKMLIMAREFGVSIEKNDIEIQSIFPPSFSSEGSVEEFMSKLPSLDEYFKSKSNMRLAATIRKEKSTVGLVQASPPLSDIGPGENIFIIQTKRYFNVPIVIRGYGAGASVTAAGVFSDILKTTKSYYNQSK